jgi:hypothetical protein
LACIAAATGCCEFWAKRAEDRPVFAETTLLTEHLHGLGDLLRPFSEWGDQGRVIGIAGGDDVNQAHFPIVVLSKENLLDSVPVGASRVGGEPIHAHHDAGM